MITMAGSRENLFNENTEAAALDRHFMQEALKEAEKAIAGNDVPVGAVIVKDGVIIARGYNQREASQDALLHAEIIAIQQACSYLKSWRLTDCTIYVTLEPCIMCAGAIIQARIDNLIFGTADPKAGACFSVARAFELPLNHEVKWQQGLLADKCSQQLKSFFQARRKEQKRRGTKGQRKQEAIRNYENRLKKEKNKNSEQG